MPGGDYKNMDPKITPPPRSELNRSMEAVIHHFKLETQGYTVPAGEAYAAVESPRGELGVLRRVRRRDAPRSGATSATRRSSTSSCLRPMVKGGLIADLIASIASLDPIMGGVDR